MYDAPVGSDLSPGVDIKIVFPDDGIIRIESARLFVEPDGLLCRRFLGQAFLAPEIDGLMRSEEQALLALELFARFLATHRRSVDLEADVRRNLRREGIIGAIEIIMHHEPRELGG